MSASFDGTSKSSRAENSEKCTKDFKELIDKEEYELRKRLPRKLPKRKTDVYVTRKTNFNCQLERSQKILDSENEVYIHGLGAAINRAINLALQLQSKGQGSVEMSAHTSTLELVDDLEPQTDDLEPETQSRNNSAIHIKMYKMNPLKVELSQDKGDAS
ncbi:ribonuclease P protein subunit p20-like [Saccostrea echinata]|uniref:ribonuclease P protein subunit p20-like n=1 Tax=Saccostrea echinata TaxID=191078 RepID=UPI002A83E67A|nr:ribonuclease P protein subunit p20-like [Saccostrea echinata]